ncbi:2-C-methyl-D-erythritol 4-phosphate cytidylyltransferase [Coraliomargarita akajimensis]|uniref:4-diphosphocytidyl-2C-methyl-D-erythritol synthase n=1 Tax=Coraliomargarita akajimensis (strain DSM 45221 / IAM 15411 / JCM 23193 / KCTC 12865 / 04OKA010-24) TaxID=583355 RepID=D5EN25_CORAD|nr:2-C-methyl-D-erythritol 4-phosphate cytidylyltransferase [Coraliomargarita akajimensis]ADE53460.1 4-diphosphocytidyl-2C-methyl-D-erythritol synthase [Coraliomargarita akajimensis DSM 45221]
MNALILLAAGSGSRMQGAVDDKVLTPLYGKPAFLWALEAFKQSAVIEHVVLVTRDDEQAGAIRKLLSKESLPLTFVHGGKERMDSVSNALEALPDGCDYVFIHDGARPLLQPETLLKLRDAAIRDGAAVLAHPVVDTIKRIPDAEHLSSQLLEDLDRKRLWAMETPQAFKFDKIRAAYAAVQSGGQLITDDTAAAASVGLGTTLVHNPHPNPKLTSPQDLEYIEWLLQRSEHHSS